MDKFTLEAGRMILRNGINFISINREAITTPIEADEAARKITEWLQGKLLGYQLEALCDSLSYLCKRANKAPINSITLPNSGAGNEGKFVCVSVDALETLLTIVKQGS